MARDGGGEGLVKVGKWRRKREIAHLLLPCETALGLAWQARYAASWSHQPAVRSPVRRSYLGSVQIVCNPTRSDGKRILLPERVCTPRQGMTPVERS